MTASAQRQFMVVIAGVSGYWATKTGGTISSDSTDVWEGIALRPEKLASPAQSEDITVSRPYRPSRDFALLSTLRGRVGSYRADLSVSDLNADMGIRGTTVTYPSALLISLSEPEVDASSGEGATIELTFAVENVTTGR